MRLWTSPDATVVDIPSGRGGTRIRLQAGGPPVVEALDQVITGRARDPFGAISAAGRDTGLRATPGLIAAVELDDGEVAALIEVRKGSIYLVRGAPPEAGRQWSDASPIGSQKPIKAAWPRGILWSESPPRSRARRPVPRPGYFTLAANAYGLAAACVHTGLVYVVRSGATPDFVLQVPTAEDARLTALPTREGVLVTLVLGGRGSAAIHYDERGREIGRRGGFGVAPPILLASDRVLWFDHGDDDQLSLLALPSLSPVGPRLPLGFHAIDAASTSSGLAFAVAGDTRLALGRLGPQGLIVDGTIDLLALVRSARLRDIAPAMAEPPPVLEAPPRPTQSDPEARELALAIDLRALADDLFADTPPPPAAVRSPVDLSSPQLVNEPVLPRPAAPPQLVNEPVPPRPAASPQLVNEPVPPRPAASPQLVNEPVLPRPAASPIAAPPIAPPIAPAPVTAPAAAPHAIEPSSASALTAPRGLVPPVPPAPLGGSADLSALAALVHHDQAPRELDGEAHTPPAPSDAPHTHERLTGPTEAPHATDEPDEPLTHTPLTHTPLPHDSDAPLTTASLAHGSDAPGAPRHTPLTRESTTSIHTPPHPQPATDEAPAPIDSDAPAHTPDGAPIAAPAIPTLAPVDAALPAPTLELADPSLAARSPAAPSLTAPALAAPASEPATPTAPTIELADPSLAAPASATPTATPTAPTTTAPTARHDALAPAPAPAPIDAAQSDLETIEVVSLDEVEEVDVPIPRPRPPTKSGAHRAPPPPPPPRIRDEPPSLALGVLSEGAIVRWQATVGDEFELVLSLRSAGGPGRGIRLTASGEALTRGLVGLTRLAVADAAAPLPRAEAGMTSVELRELEIPAGLVHPFDPPPPTPEALAVAETVLASTHRDFRLRGRGLRPGSGLLALSITVLGSSAPPLRWIRPIAVTAPS